MSMNINQIICKEDWRSVLFDLGSYDFIHTFDFHKVSELNNEGVPLLFSAVDQNERTVACWPTLKRNIENTDFFDLTSVYGYGGPLFAAGADVKSCFDSLLNSMADLGAVSLFSRMHPLFVEQVKNVDDRGIYMSDVVVIDVNLTDEILSNYRDSHRREIVNARKFGVSVNADLDCHDLESFLRIYRNSMKDLNAVDYYYFTDNYFKEFTSSSEFKPFILFAELGGVKIAAAMFVITGKIMQYYLSGTDASFKKLSPSKMLIAYAHQLASEFGIEKIILGGGVGSSRDSLYKFKEGFSNISMPFYVTKKIFNNEAYQEICGMKKIDPTKNTFFPAYRV